MVKQSPMAGLVHLTIFLGLLIVEGTNVVLTNNMDAEVGITCQLEDTIPGDSQIVFPGNTYEFEITEGSSNFTGGRRYNCVFAAMDKPRTILEVFVSTGFASDGPCNNCPGGVCAWSISANGFSCNGFSHGWGN